MGQALGILAGLLGLGVFSDVGRRFMTVVGDLGTGPVNGQPAVLAGAGVHLLADGFAMTFLTSAHECGPAPGVPALWRLQLDWRQLIFHRGMGTTTCRRFCG